MESEDLSSSANWDNIERTRSERNFNLLTNQLSQSCFDDSIINQLTQQLWNTPISEQSFPFIQIPDQITPLQMYEIKPRTHKYIIDELTMSTQNLLNVTSWNMTLEITEFKTIEEVLNGELQEQEVRLEGARRVFYGQKLDTQEMKIIQKFKEYLILNNISHFVPSSIFQGDLLALRCLNIAKRNFQKTFQLLQKIIQWEIQLDTRFVSRQKTLKLLVSSNQNQGFIYTFGRDYDQRPVIVFNLFKIRKMQQSIQNIKVVVHILLSYVKMNFLIPGKVETWIIIFDFHKLSSISYVKNRARKFINIMTRMYPNKLHHMYFVNTPRLIRIIFKPFSLFLSRSILKKLVVLKSSQMEELLRKIPRFYLQMKYGGICPNLKSEFFPPYE